MPQAATDACRLPCFPLLFASPTMRLRLQESPHGDQTSEWFLVLSITPPAVLFRQYQSCVKISFLAQIASSRQTDTHTLCIYIHVYVYVCVYTYVYIYTYIYMYIHRVLHTHIYIYIYMLPPPPRRVITIWVGRTGLDRMVRLAGRGAGAWPCLLSHAWGSPTRSLALILFTGRGCGAWPCLLSHPPILRGILPHAALR